MKYAGFDLVLTEVFPSLWARKPMPKLDFIKVFKKQQGRIE